jgi:hypothetical protein
MPLGFEYELYRPDRVNFSRFWIGTKSSRIEDASYNLNSILNELSSNLQ